jgi:hypothetical protein
MYALLHVLQDKKIGAQAIASDKKTVSALDQKCWVFPNLTFSFGTPVASNHLEGSVLNAMYLPFSHM